MNHIAERIAIEFTTFKHGGVISFTESIDTFVKNLSEVQPSVFLGSQEFIQNFSWVYYLNSVRKNLISYYQFLTVIYYQKRKSKKD